MPILGYEYPHLALVAFTVTCFCIGFGLATVVLHLWDRKRKTEKVAGNESTTSGDDHQYKGSESDYTSYGTYKTKERWE